MSKPPAAVPQEASEELRLLRTYFDLTEQEASARNAAEAAVAARAQARDRLLAIRAEDRGFSRGVAQASAARTQGDKSE